MPLGMFWREVPFGMQSHKLRLYLKSISRAWIRIKWTRPQFCTCHYSQSTLLRYFYSHKHVFCVTMRYKNVILADVWRYDFLVSCSVYSRRIQACNISLKCCVVCFAHLARNKINCAWFYFFQTNASGNTWCKTNDFSITNFSMNAS